MLKLLADLQSAVVERQGGVGAHDVCEQLGCRREFEQPADHLCVIQHRLARSLVPAAHGRAHHDRNEPLQKSVILAGIGKLADRPGLRAADDRHRQIVDMHAAARDAVDGL